MKKAFSVLLILSATLLSACAHQASQTPISNQPTQPPGGTVLNENVPAPSYLQYENDILTQVVTPKRVLFFYANWCPTCKPVDVELTSKTSAIPSDMTIILVNYNDSETDDTERNFRQYGVTYQHTFVQIDSEGNEVAKWNGGGLAEIISNVK